MGPIENNPSEQSLLSHMLDTALEISNVWSLEFVGACLHSFFSRLVSGEYITVVLEDSLLNGFIMIPGGQQESISGIDSEIFDILSRGNFIKTYHACHVFPVVSSRKSYGFVRIESTPVIRTLSDDTTEKILKFMKLIATTFENSLRMSHAERALSERDSQLIIMHEMGELIGSISDVDHLNSVIINMVKEVMSVHLCGLMIFDDDGATDEDHSFILLPEDRDRMNKDVLQIWEHMGRECWSKQKTILINDISREDHDYLPDMPKQISYPFLSTPLLVNQKVAGIIHVSNKFFDERFTYSDVDFLSAFANQISKAIENAKLHQNLQSFSLMTISSLMSVIETKDPFMKGHSERVAIYAKSLSAAVEPPLPPETINMIEYAAILHDIGKIGVAREILNKKTPLKEQEMREIKKHPSLGKKILRPLKFLEDAGILIDHHQERYDGNGYPDELAGNNIPLGARIIAIADSFDAMTSMRPYRKRLPIETAREELRSNAGSQFDPDLVVIFLQLLDDKLFENTMDLMESSDLSSSK